MQEQQGDEGGEWGTEQEWLQRGEQEDKMRRQNNAVEEEKIRRNSGKYKMNCANGTWLFKHLPQDCCCIRILANGNFAGPWMIVFKDFCTSCLADKSDPKNVPCFNL